MRNLLPLVGACALAISAVGLQAQTVILDFETPATSTTFQFFGSSLEGQLSQVIENPDKSGINTSDSVLQFIEPAGGLSFAGAFSNPVPPTPIDLSVNTQICIDAWMPVVDALTLKLEEPVGGGGDWEATASVTAPNTWEQLCFDATMMGGAGTPAAAGRTFGKVVLFVGLGDTTTMDVTSYFDNLVTEPGAMTMEDITFQLDLTGFSGAVTSANVAGTFNNWTAAAGPLTDDDGDGIYTGTYSVPSGAQEFKFVVNGDFEELLPTDVCTVTSGGFTNRSLFVSEADTLAAACYGSCYACGEEVAITFELGTNNITVDAGGVFIAGGGNFGAPGDNPLADDDGDGVYEITFRRPRGFSSYYAFANGNCPDFSCKENLSGQACADPGNFNDRFFPAVTQDTTISTCYGVCRDDTDCGPPPAQYQVTFAIDVRDYDGPATNSFFVAGSFNNWNGEELVMMDPEGDSVYTFTLPLTAGQYEYKFKPDEWDNSEQFDPNSADSLCTLTTGTNTNRVVQIASDTTLPVYRWASCDLSDIMVSTRELADLGVGLRALPSVTDGELRLDFGAPLPLAGTVNLLDATGRVFRTEVAARGRTMTLLDLSDLPRGMYFVRLDVAGAVGAVRVLRQ